MVERVVIVGQGYVGLPLAIRAVEVGFDVVGIDLDQHRIDGLARGTSHVEDVTDQRVQAALDSGRYCPSTSYDDAEGFDIAIVSVPTQYTKRPLLRSRE